MNNLKTSGILYIAAGVFFVISAIMGGSLIYLVLAAVLIVLGLRNLKRDE